MNIIPKNIKIYCDSNGKEPFSEWISSLSIKDRARIFTRLDRVETGNVRFHFGSGYRVYYGELDNTIILLLCGGDKSSQKRDVKKAKIYWKDYLNRKEL